MRVGPSMHINPIGLIGQQGLRCHVISMSGKSPTKLEATSPKITYTVLTGKLNLKWKNKQNQNWMRTLQNINCSKDNYFKRSKNSWWVCVLLLLYILNILMIKMLQYKMYPAGELRCPTTALVSTGSHSVECPPRKRCQLAKPWHIQVWNWQVATCQVLRSQV